MEILDLLAKITNQSTRREGALELARQFAAEDLLIFIKDHQINVYLPAHGFPQTISGGKVWTSFLTQPGGEWHGSVPVNKTMLQAVGIREMNDSVAVLVGGKPGAVEINLLKKILTILSPLLLQEQMTLVAESQAMHSGKLAEKAEKLTVTLDTIRNSLMKVLEENASLLTHIKKQNADLAATNSELAASNEEVRAGLEELDAANKKLISINADLDTFIYTASHDLKSPIANIEGLLTLLISKLKRNGWEDESTVRIIGMIKTSIERFKHTLSDLTEISKIGKEEESYEDKINLLELVEDLKSDLHFAIVESKAELKVELEKGTVLCFSKKNFKSILYNLLSNSIKYRHLGRPPLIAISGKTEADYFVLQVADNGLGMDTTDKNKIFGLFKRLHQHVEGTGIGLYIVKKIIENNGGKIEVESKVGVGTIFKLYFPKK